MDLAARNGEYDAAIGCYETFLGIAPDLKTAWLAKGWLFITWQV